jgi:GT2 family glycosyltransferase
MVEPQVSVIIPLWNGRAYILPCLEALMASVLHSRRAVEIIVVDNGSSDGSAELVEAHFGGEKLRLIRNGRNLGFAGGCNVGIKAAGGERLLLLNQDTEVDREWIAVLDDALLAEAGIVGSLALLPGGEFIQHAGGAIEWPLGVARHLGYGETLGREWRSVSDPDFVTAAAMGIHRQVLQQVGLFDERFWPGYYEDADLCYRARAAGYRVRYLPDAMLIHQESASFHDPLLTRWARLRGRLRFCLKHCTPQFFLEDFLPAERGYREAVLAGDRLGFIARAYLEAIPMMLEMWQGRATLEEMKSASDSLQVLYSADLHGWTVDKAVDNLDFVRTSVNSSTKALLTVSPLDRLPVVGSLWRQARLALHRLVIFYVERRHDRLQAIIHEQAEYIERLEAERGAGTADRRPGTADD